MELTLDIRFLLNMASGKQGKNTRRSIKMMTHCLLEPRSFQLPGEDGREITVVRTVKDSQGNVRSEQTFTSVYDPKDEVILKGTA